MCPQLTLGRLGYRKCFGPLFRKVRKTCRYGNVCIVDGFNYNTIDWEHLVGDPKAEWFIEIVKKRREKSGNNAYLAKGR